MATIDRVLSEYLRHQKPEIVEQELSWKDRLISQEILLNRDVMVCCVVPSAQISTDSLFWSVVSLPWVWVRVLWCGIKRCLGFLPPWNPWGTGFHLYHITTFLCVISDDCVINHAVTSSQVVHLYLFDVDKENIWQSCSCFACTIVTSFILTWFWNCMYNMYFVTLIVILLYSQGWFSSFWETIREKWHG